MKIKYIIGTIIVLSCAFVGIFLTTNHSCPNKYNLADEYSYSILQKNFDNSLILTFAGIDASKIKDIATTVNKLSHKTKQDAEAHLNYIKIKTNMQQTKANAIAQIKANDVNLMSRSLDQNNITEVLQLLKNEFEETINMASTEENKAETIDTLIGTLIFSPQINYLAWADSTPAPIILAAEPIAISRFDNLKEYQKINNCYQTSKDSQISGIDNQTLLNCAEEYRNNVSQEMDKVIKELSEHKDALLNVKKTPEQEKRDRKNLEFYKQFEGKWEISSTNELSYLFENDINITAINSRPGSVNPKILLLYSKNKKALMCMRYNENDDLMMCSDTILNTDQITKDARFDLIFDGPANNQTYIVQIKKDGKTLYVSGSTIEDADCKDNTSYNLAPLFELKQK